MKWEGEHIRLASDKLWSDAQRLEGWDASTGPQPPAQRHAGDTAAQSKSCRGELGAPEVVGANKEASVKHPKGNKGCSSVQVARPTAQMKWLYTNAHSMGNKQQELEGTMLLEIYDLIVIAETWWGESRDWSVVIDGHRLFRRDRWGKRGGSLDVCIKKSIQCEELSLKNSHEKVESLWVRIRHRGNKGNLVVGVYYRLLDQGEPIDEAFFLQLQEVSCL